VGVFAGDASRQGYALVDKRLCLPEVWWSDAYAARRARGTVPEELTFQSTPPWAAAMWQAMVQERLRPCKDVVADGLDGHSPDFLAAVAAGVGVTALVAVSSETRGWLQAPRTMAKPSLYKGAARSQRGVGGPDHAPGTVAAVAAPLPASQWYRRQGSEGTTGPREYVFARHRVTLCPAGLPERPGWLVLNRTVGADPVYSDYISNAPGSTPWRPLVWLRGGRWAMAQCVAAGNTALGMAH
jgi:hypothetical protein